MTTYWDGIGRRLKTAWRAAAALLAAGTLASLAIAQVTNTSKISNTAHNLSRSGVPNQLSNVRAPAGGEEGICVFCHTPHGASTTVNGPLWNRSASTATYTRYTSASLDANHMVDGFSDQPAGSSVLCLSCHDGMVALGNVNVLNGKSQTITLDNTENGRMPSGLGGLTGFTRLIGTDLTNDHPISITYNNALAAMDGELTGMSSNLPTTRDTVTGKILGVRGNGSRPLLPLEPTGPGGIGQVQCGTCHDPHLAAEKFLRLNRFQKGAPTGGSYNEASDQICLACHPKLNQTWADSAHANPIVADETYVDAAASRRNFPAGTKVWQAACLNCHDTHTVQGARRLLREGVTSNVVGADAGSYRLGSAITPEDSVSAIENTCYQCHDLDTSSTRVIGKEATSRVPDVKTEFNRPFRMPITTSDQWKAKKEVHNIRDADFLESPENLGRHNHENRHVECTDCHNPHRVRRSSTFYGVSSVSGEGAKRTHNVGGPQGNVASGALRGAWGVEPVFGPPTNDWPQNPISWIVKKGDPGNDTSTDRNKTYLTREYQLCFKCHSNYSNGDTKFDFPALGSNGGGTTGSPAFRNNMSRYTNVAGEFGSVRATDPPSSGTDQGEHENSGNACSGGDCVPSGSYPAGLSGQDYNHRSWHPVMWPTGRDRGERAMSSTGGINLLPPFAANIGIQTMHCSDCHGEETSWIRGTGPNPDKTQGPHGSQYKFLLKGTWDNSVTLNNVTTVGNFCGNCHNPKGNSNGSGFGGDHVPDSNMGGETCMWCHISVPHGWRNKAFLANLRCVGTEAGEAGTCVNIGAGTTYGVVTRGPYYNYTRLRISTWARSGNWSSGSCGGRDMEDGCPESD